jgi:hypothetical protein
VIKERSMANIRRSVVPALLLVLLAVTPGVGCATVRLIGDYDDAIDKGVTEVQQKAELYFATLRSTPSTPFDQTFYDDLSARLAVLKTRAASLPQYTIIGQQIANLQTQFDTFQRLDKVSARPFPGVAVTDAQSAIAVSVESILRLELALKRGVAPPAK